MIFYDHTKLNAGLVSIRYRLVRRFTDELQELKHSGEGGDGIQRRRQRWWGW